MATRPYNRNSEIWFYVKVAKKGDKAPAPFVVTLYCLYFSFVYGLTFGFRNLSVLQPLIVGMEKVYDVIISLKSLALRSVD
jgi:hypothetical protein